MRGCVKQGTFVCKEGGGQRTPGGRGGAGRHSLQATHLGDSKSGRQMGREVTAGWMFREVCEGGSKRGGGGKGAKEQDA